MFKVACMLHPIGYLNKILFAGSSMKERGQMQLWNIKSSKLVYSYEKANLSSPVTILKQAPAIDVVAIGLQNGQIILHNLKYDETLVSFMQEWGPITSLAFRTGNSLVFKRSLFDFNIIFSKLLILLRLYSIILFCFVFSFINKDGSPIMISGSCLGHMAIWNLEEKRLIAQLREAHNAAIEGMQALQFEPLIVTSSSDNSLKVWIFDMSDGSCRMLRQRHGHSAPPTRLSFHGGGVGESILSAGSDSCLFAFSTEHDSKNKSLGRALYNKVEASKANSSVIADKYLMSPIVELSSNEVKQSDWDGIVCVHENHRTVTTWDYVRSTMGKHKIDHDRFKKNERLYGGVIATVSS
jgi:U3 small nucleolar RNA-associated protein 21